MNQTVIGVFATNQEAQQAVTSLRNEGYEDAHIDLSSRDTVKDYDARNKKVGGFFSSLFGDDDNDTRTAYMETAKRGTVVTVHTDKMNRAERAADILDEYGAIDANDGYSNLCKRGIAETDTDSTLEVIKEDLMVGKKTVETGGVRVRSQVISKPVSETVRLREEEVFVTRTPVDRPATAGDFNTFKEGTVTMKETAEVPVVQKTARVVEEVSVGKTAHTHAETVTETVRETEVDVERIAGDAVASASTTVNAAGSAVGSAVGAVGDAARSAGNTVHNALDRDNDGEIVDLNDRDGRIG